MRSQKKLSILAALLAVVTLSGCDTNTSESNSSTEIPTTVPNGSFEEGDLKDWTRSGMAFNNSSIVKDDQVNGVVMNKDGDYFLYGAATNASSKGVLTSSVFKLTGTGYVSYRIGAAKDATKCYVQFFKEGDPDTPLTFKANGGTEELTSIGNPDFNGTTLTDNLITNYIDLSAYVDENIYMVVTDNDTKKGVSDYAYVNLDAVRTITTDADLEAVKSQRTVDIAPGIDDFTEDPAQTSLPYGGFENGDLTGWKVLEGRAFSKEGVVPSSTLFWGNRNYYGVGNYLFSGDVEANYTGSMRSQKFTVKNDEGNIYASFMMGAGKRKTTKVSLVDCVEGQEDQVVETFTNDQYFADPNFALNLIYRLVDLTPYKGHVMYFLVEDESGEGEDFNFLTLDDFKVNLTADEVKADITKWKTASTYDVEGNVDTVTGASNYISLYNKSFSYPFAGEAPKADVDENGFVTTAVTTPAVSYSIAPLLSNIRDAVHDDYTSQNDLTVTFTSYVKPDSTEVSVEAGTTTIDTTANGDYVLNFTVTDAYEQSTSVKAKVTVQGVTDNIINGDFETGDLTGWTLEDGSTLSSTAPVSSAESYWDTDEPFNKGGEYFFSEGFPGDGGYQEGDNFRLRSMNFELSGSGYITFKLGGNAAKLAVYDASTDEQIALYGNTCFSDVASGLLSEGARRGTMTTFVADLHEYLGDELYLVLIDDGTSSIGAGGWFFTTADDINCYWETAPVASEHVDTVTQTVDGTPSEYTIPWVDAVNSLALVAD